MSTHLLRQAYAQGYFPMPHPHSNELLWLSPDPRAIIPLDGLHVSRSLQRTMGRGHLSYSYDKDFAGVMQGCSERADTWITDEFKVAYQRLHAEGYAHSVEIWQDSKLVGGVYGVALHGAFFAESKFHRVTDASKMAIVKLVERMKICGMELLEVQFLTEHLKTLGTIEVPRRDYMQLLSHALSSPAKFTPA
ncbi:MAG: leucyl/phenylalanyl-tRNA--protein transferase [Pseudomonadota bacterium]